VVIVLFLGEVKVSQPNLTKTHDDRRSARGLCSYTTTWDTILIHDYQRMLAADPAAPAAQYAAFDFFVCAEHLADWVAKERGGTLTQHRAYADGALVSHVANGAKHFRVDPTRHTTVRDTASSGAYQRGAFQSDAFQTATLVIALESNASVSANEVASRVLSHWKSLL
jgi:hypothetical protein